MVIGMSTEIIPEFVPEPGSRLAATPQQRILSYLGELRSGDTVPVMRIANDLDMAYGTTAQHIRQFISMNYVLAIKLQNKTVVSLNPTLAPSIAARLIPEWQDWFGAHPIHGRMQRRIHIVGG